MNLLWLLIWPGEALLALLVLLGIGWWEERDTRRRIAEDDEVSRLEALFQLQGPER